MHLKCSSQNWSHFLKQRMRGDKNNPNLKLIPRLFVFDPDFPLGLGVNEEGEACCFGDNNAILNGQVIIWETLEGRRLMIS